MTAPVAAVVLASRGGPRLARALASVEWASERIVLDPGRRLDATSLPAGVARAHEPELAADAPWLLLLEEHEVVPPSLAAAIREVASASESVVAYRIARETRALGATLRVAGEPVRLAQNAGTRVRLGAGLRAELSPPPGRTGRLGARIVVTGAESLERAVEDLDADAGTLAALLHASGVRPSVGHMIGAPLVAGTSALIARGPLGAFWARWALAVLGGYRVMVAYAKLWETLRGEAARPS